MANRNIQSKLAKMKRARWRSVKSFASKGAGPMKHPGYFNDSGEWVDVSLRSRSKAAASVIDEHLIQKYRYKTDSPEAIYARHRGLHTDLTRDGEIVLARLNQSKSGVGGIQGEEQFVYQKIADENYIEIRLYMGRTMCFFVGVRMRGDAKEILTSIQYGDRHVALKRLRDKEVVWDERVVAPTTDASSAE